MVSFLKNNEVVEMLVCKTKTKKWFEQRDKILSRYEPFYFTDRPLTADEFLNKFKSAGSKVEHYWKSAINRRTRIRRRTLKKIMRHGVPPEDAKQLIGMKIQFGEI